ncbi:uncharacterized protein LOC131025477 [Salvia miltiorrhiza]|uniref:uncharacterized protein LOC131025477 n=1 Tax=Salvia miltiorrhiza TaxID=226208 RepID=UPI0025ACA4B1|nr:uncharacterized protein LOC131025477 [Salvia miltiorrhiza]
MSETDSDHPHDEETQPPLLPPAPYRWKRPSLIYETRAINLYVRNTIFEEIRTTLKAVGGKSTIQTFKSGTIGRLSDHERYASANNVLHHLLSRQIEGGDIPPHEAWFVVGSRIIRFTAPDYALITGLHFGFCEFDPDAEHQIPANSIFYRYFGGRPTKVGTLKTKFKAKQLGKDPEDYIKAGNLLMYYLFLLCRDDVYIEAWAWTLVEDLDEWNWFPWGSYTYQVLLHYLSLAGTRDDVLKKPAYHFFGPVWALQIWSYEVIPTLGSICGTRNPVPKFPRALMWTT